MKTGTYRISIPSVFNLMQHLHFTRALKEIPREWRGLRFMMEDTTRQADKNINHAIYVAAMSVVRKKKTYKYSTELATNANKLAYTDNYFCTQRCYPWLFGNLNRNICRQKTL